jgi:hypothetical protein
MWLNPFCSMRDGYRTNLRRVRSVLANQAKSLAIAHGARLSFRLSSEPMRRDITVTTGGLLTPDSDQTADIAAGAVGARKSRAPQQMRGLIRSPTHSITSSARASSCIMLFTIALTKFV